MLLAFFAELLHPYHGVGYQFWSGLGSDIGELPLIFSAVGIFLTLYRHLECHQERCHRLGRFRHGHLRLCHVHHPLVPNDGKIDAELIAAAVPEPPTVSVRYTEPPAVKALGEHLQRTIRHRAPI